MARAGSSNTHDVMISYNWGSKETVLKIRDSLKQNGVSCWIDVEKMSGSTLEAMSAAVENCTVFLMCYSEKYLQSKNCQSEAEYAQKKQKIIIPCNMEKGFDPSGWLGIIIGSKLFFDFSGKYPFEKKMPELIREIQLHLKKVTDCSLATKVETALKMEGDPIENSKGAGKENSFEQKRRKHYCNEYKTVKLAGKLMDEKSKEETRKEFEEKRKRHYNEYHTLKLHKKLLEEEDKA